MFEKMDKNLVTKSQKEKKGKKEVISEKRVISVERIFRKFCNKRPEGNFKIMVSI